MNNNKLQVDGIKMLPADLFRKKNECYGLGQYEITDQQKKRPGKLHNKNK